MRLLIKISLAFVLLLGVVYLGSPWWLASLVSNRLPPGWQLEELETGYPGLDRIQIESVLISSRGELAELNVRGAAGVIHYRERKMAFQRMWLDVAPGSLQVAEPQPVSLPLIEIPAGLELPEISVAALHLRFFPRAGSLNPLVLDLQQVRLRPGDTGYRLDSGFHLAGYPGVEGRLDTRLTDSGFLLDIDLLAAGAVDPWLRLGFRQENDKGAGSSQLMLAYTASLDSENAGDRLIAQLSRGRLTAIDGDLRLTLDLAGNRSPRLQGLEVETRQLKVSSSSESLLLNARLRLRGTDGSLRSDSAGVLEARYHATAAGMLDTWLAELSYPGPGSTRARLVLRDLRLETVPVRPWQALELTADMLLDWREEQPVRLMAGKITAEQLELRLQGPVRLMGGRFAEFSGTDLQLSGKGLRYEDAEGGRLQAAAVEGEGRLRLKLPFDGTAMEYRLDADLQAVTPVLSAPAASDGALLQAGQARIDLRLEQDGTGLVSNGEAKFQRFSYQAGNPPGFDTPELQLNWRDLEAVAGSGRFQVQTGEMNIKAGEESYRGFTLRLETRLLADARLRGSGEVMLAGQKLPLRFEGGLDDSDWQLAMAKNTMPFTALGELLRVANLPPPPGFSVNSGEMELEVCAVPRDDLKIDLTASVKDANFQVLENLFQNAVFNLQLDVDGETSLGGGFHVQRLQAAAGLDIDAIQGRLELALARGEAFPQQGRLTLTDFSALLFGGRLELSPLVFERGVLSETRVELAAIELAELLEFVAVDGLRGSGKLDVTLPVAGDSQGLFVKGGVFQSRAPGRLVFKGQGMAGNIGLQALENFHYSNLSGTIDYQADGGYQVFIALDGKNPDLYAGHPVALKLTINGELPAVFKALFVTGDFNEAILKQVRGR